MPRCPRPELPVVLPNADAQADDVPELQPLADRVLIKVEEVADVTLGGVILPDSAKERPLSGTVVRTGPGKYDKDAEGKRKAMTVSGEARGAEDGSGRGGRSHWGEEAVSVWHLSHGGFDGLSGLNGSVGRFHGPGATMHIALDTRGMSGPGPMAGV